MINGTEVVAIVDALVALRDPSPESVAQILGTTFAPGRRSEQFDGVFTHGPFEKASLRYYKELSAGLLIVDARPNSGLVATNIDLRKYGPPPPPEVSSPTHLGGSEGYYSLGFTPARGVKVHFQFTQQTARLYKIVVDWESE